MAAPVSQVFERLEPWTETDFLALPVDRRIELVDGSLLVSPSARGRNQRLSFRLTTALDAAVPDGLEVLEAINIRVGPGRILIPDIAVISHPGLDLTVDDAVDVAMVVEITGPGNAAADRAIKPQLYAQSGIDHYLRVELRPPGPHAFAYRLVHGRYVEVTRAGPGQVLELAEPVFVTLELSALVTRTRPAD